MASISDEDSKRLRKALLLRSVQLDFETLCALLQKRRDELSRNGDTLLWTLYDDLLARMYAEVDTIAFTSDAPELSLGVSPN